MKRLILTLLLVISLISPVYAQNGYISGNQLFPQTITATAGENLTAGKVVSLINESGTIKAYNNATTASTSPNGSEYVFNSATTTYCNAVALDSSRFLVAFKKTNNTGAAIIGTISGSSISYGSLSNEFDSGMPTDYISSCLIDTDKVLVVFYVSAQVKARMTVLSISNNAITVNTSADFSTVSGATVNAISLTKLDTNKALCCFQRLSKGESRIITVSGTTPTPYPAAGTAGTEFNAAATSYISVSALSSASAIVAYQDGGNSNYGTSQVLSISGTTITPGTEYVFRSATSYIASVTSLSSTVAVIADADGTDGNARVATVSGTAISFGADASFTSYVDQMGVAKIDNTKFIIVAQNGNTNAKSVVGTVSGTAISFGSEYNYNAANTRYSKVCYLGNQKSAIVYQDVDNFSYGTCCINTWASPAYYAVAGTAYSTVTSGNPVKVITNGLDTNQSGLITGSEYYLQSDFTIGTTPVALASKYTNTTQTAEIYIGTAKSATQLWVQPDYK